MYLLNFAKYTHDILKNIQHTTFNNTHPFTGKNYNL